MQKEFFLELQDIILSNELTSEQIVEELENYHESDIADALEKVDKDDRLRIYNIIGFDKTAEIFAFYEDVENYIEELDPNIAADILEKMDVSDAVDVLEELTEDDKTEIIELMEEDAKEAVQTISAYDEEVIGSHMTDNYIVIKNNLSIKQAMSQIVKEAGDHDNIYTLYVVDENDKFFGAIELKELICARKDDNLVDLVMTSYPSFYDDELVEDCINKLKDYAESSIPILNREEMIVGVITGDILLDIQEEEFSEDYAKFAGLTESEDIDESIFSSIKKRIPWLVILLFLGLTVSTVVGAFEGVIATIPVFVFFQSIVLDMSGNAGTQSLSVTIQNITSDELETKKQKRRNTFKELRVAFFDGLLLSVVAFLFVIIFLAIKKQEVVEGSGYVFIDTVKVAGIIALSLISSMTIAGLIGCTFPLILKKLNVDPAVASGPFITTINDLIAVSTYYGLAYLFFILLL